MATARLSTIRDDSTALQDDLVQLRRTLHADPETGLDLPRTQEHVLAALQGLPLEVTTGTDTTSVVAVLRGGATRRTATPRTVLLRGDMDALPVVEETGEDFAATNGAMHACGHDLHTTALVGAAKLLAQHRDQVAGDVVFMFQPGEEGFDGAAVMLDEGVLDAAGTRVDQAFAIHVFSNLMPTGIFISSPGTILAASHGLRVTVRGEGGHGASPHHARDPISAAADMVTSLQTMITRTFDVFDPVVLSVGVIARRHQAQRHPRHRVVRGHGPQVQRRERRTAARGHRPGARGCRRGARRDGRVGLRRRVPAHRQRRRADRFRRGRDPRARRGGALRGAAAADRGLGGLLAGPRGRTRFLHRAQRLPAGPRSGCRPR